MKSKCVLILATLMLSLWAYQTDSISKSEDVSIDILCDGRWFNDEFDFVFYKDGNVKSHYTFVDRSGIMSGKVKLKDDTHFSVLNTSPSPSYNAFFLKSGTADFVYVNDPSNPKSTRYITNADQTLILWNEKYVPPIDSILTIDPGKTKCVALGNKLSTTIDNVRIRKGPGTEYENMMFHYKEMQTGQVKSHGSILSGTDIRVLARTVDKMKVNNWNNYWYFIEYKEPGGQFLEYKTAWMYGEFIYIQGDPSHAVDIVSPKNEASYYNEFDKTISGEVTGKPNKIIFRMKNAYGQIVREDTVKSYNKNAGTFTYNISKENRTVFIGSNTYAFVAIYSDGKNAMKQITLYFHESQGEMAKPVIYLYPTQPGAIAVTVHPPHGISQSDPLYGNGWNVYANPEGKIIASDGKTYPYLFWESSNYAPPKVETGFIVARQNLLSFFREKLSILGLNQKEINDFTEYWIPVLNKGPFYRIHFFEQEIFNAMAPLSVTPKPDTIIRVFFDAQPLEQPIQIQEQQLIPIQRKGFTVVEWGGMRY